MYINLNEFLTTKVTNINNLSFTKDNNGNPIFNWNDNIYYPKRFNLNEFIGSYIAEKIDLRTVFFECFRYIDKVDNNQIFIASKSFNNPTSKYSYIISDNIITKNILPESLINECIDSENITKLTTNILKMTVIDIYMGQFDRNHTNLQKETYDTGYIDLAPIYDYTEADFNDTLFYENPLFTFSNEDDYKELFKNYPLSLELLKKVKKLNLINIIHDIEEYKGFKLPSNIIDIYKIKEEKTQKKLEKIIK